ncbi:GNAT family N-acetyltransferase [Lentilactobacillus otakiensis]|uniref:N-acetyltransferase n=1 Tax=Lentilactobacillus otakiensis DSM 19908 = JCM 15040 TaxID=1423780 RepID=S4NK49_9LACO|nr:GNAT family protein [Lentilactobacillus otakiensis]KRL10292.1 N-acetyltransferase GCN5 [Lentilactobacillus otakiensis DSM 19908 = JCM 15040]MBZ3777393.1 GNAT family N-acetyltransferase [Lentilactobacillus otakiensis]MDV3517318.1 GNAT family protein [Lentilactobacillus otakiensis]GAD16286.1 N-acetyltransferase [Lentilactobacillus otakiensis DSM 19908 = JCM 15040]
MFINKVNDHISLKLPAVTDADAMLELIDSNRKRLAEWLPWAKSMMAPSDEQKFLQYGIEKMARGDFWFAIILVDNEPAGMIDLHEFSHDNQRAQIGYWLADQYQGMGVMTLCLNQLEQIAFDELGLNRLELIADVANKKSRAVAERRGFHQDGILKEYLLYNGKFHDVVLYSKLKSE